MGLLCWGSVSVIECVYTIMALHDVIAVPYTLIFPHTVVQMELNGDVSMLLVEVAGNVRQSGTPN